MAMDPATRKKDSPDWCDWRADCDHGMAIGSRNFGLIVDLIRSLQNLHQLHVANLGLVCYCLKALQAAIDSDKTPRLSEGLTLLDIANNRLDTGACLYLGHILADCGNIETFNVLRIELDLGRYYVLNGLNEYNILNYL